MVIKTWIKIDLVYKFLAHRNGTATVERAAMSRHSVLKHPGGVRWRQSQVESTCARTRSLNISLIQINVFFLPHH